MHELLLQNSPVEVISSPSLCLGACGHFLRTPKPPSPRATFSVSYHYSRLQPSMPRSRQHRMTPHHVLSPHVGLNLVSRSNRRDADGLRSPYEPEFALLWLYPATLGPVKLVLCMISCSVPCAFACCLPFLLLFHVSTALFDCARLTCRSRS